jgi:hypothetical protein
MGTRAAHSLSWHSHKLKAVPTEKDKIEIRDSKNVWHGPDKQQLTSRNELNSFQPYKVCPKKYLLNSRNQIYWSFAVYRATEVSDGKNMITWFSYMMLVYPNIEQLWFFCFDVHSFNIRKILKTWCSLLGPRLSSYGLNSHFKLGLFFYMSKSSYCHCVPVRYLTTYNEAILKLQKS